MLNKNNGQVIVDIKSTDQYATDIGQRLAQIWQFDCKTHENKVAEPLFERLVEDKGLIKTHMQSNLQSLFRIWFQSSRVSLHVNFPRYSFNLVTNVIQTRPCVFTCIAITPITEDQNVFFHYHQKNYTYYNLQRMWNLIGRWKKSHGFKCENSSSFTYFYSGDYYFFFYMTRFISIGKMLENMRVINYVSNIRERK